MTESDIRIIIQNKNTPPELSSERPRRVLLVVSARAREALAIFVYARASNKKGNLYRNFFYLIEPGFITNNDLLVH